MLETATIVTGCAAAVFGYSFASAWLRRGAPFVPTAARKIDAIFATSDGLLSRLPSSRRHHLIDLGAGSGTLVRAAVRQGKFDRATGYEINPALVSIARLVASDSEAHRLQSLWEADLTDCDVVCVYGVPSMMDDLAAKLCNELPDGSHVCSNLFELPSSASGTRPSAAATAVARLTEVDRRWVDAGRWSMDDSGYVRLYRVDRDAGDGGVSSR